MPLEIKDSKMLIRLTTTLLISLLFLANLKANTFPIEFGDNFVSPQKGVPFKGTRLRLKDHNQYSSFSEKSLELKFLIDKLGTKNQVLYFQDPETYPFHYQLAGALDGTEYDRTSFASMCQALKKRFLCGYIKYVPYDEERKFQKLGYLWSVPEHTLLTVTEITSAQKILKTNLPFKELWDMIGGGGLSYKFSTFWMPQGSEQKLMATNPKLNSTPIVFPEDLIKKGEEKILNFGFTVGLLREYKKNESQKLLPSPTDIVLLDYLPLDLPPVAGVITSVDQPELSHINLLSKNRGTPNVYIEGVLGDPKYLGLVGKLVKFRVRYGSVAILPATMEEFERFWSVKRPDKVSNISYNANYQEIENLETTSLSRDQLKSIFGSKATNLATLSKIDGIGTPDFIFGVPFSFYQTHMENSGLQSQLSDLLSNTSFKESSAIREEKLKEFRKKIKKSVIDPHLLEKIREILISRGHDGKPVRFRSSSNVEDLEFFNGAGLYSSKTGYANPPTPEEGKKHKSIQRAILKVWASLWNFQAFEEREFYKINHHLSAMGILIHPAFPSSVELANGVALTRKDRYGFYANISIAEGDKSITNPDLDDLRASFKIMASISFHDNILKVKSPSDDYLKIISKDKLESLVKQFQSAHSELEKSHTLKSGDNMDIEFKLVSETKKIMLKQIRPSKLNTAVYGLPTEELKSRKSYIDRQKSAPYIYRSHCVSNKLEYFEENYGTKDREPGTGHVLISLKQDIMGIGKAGDQFEFFNGEDQTYIGHPFMHHGPYDLSLNAPKHPVIQDFQVIPGGGITINGHISGGSLKGPMGQCDHEDIFENHPVILEMEMKEIIGAPW